MKIAIASDDGAQIASHFGRSVCFLVFEIEEQRIVGREVRPNTLTAHARGECGGEGHSHEHATCHVSILEALHDCQAVLCRGMGRHAAEDLKAQGIQAYVLIDALTPEEAMQSFLRGELKVAEGFCHCHE